MVARTLHAPAAVLNQLELEGPGALCRRKERLHVLTGEDIFGPDDR